jgi:DNA-binding NarL/FixJ family response regulator
MSNQDATPCREKLRVLIVDDHALVRDGLKRIINEQDDMEVVADAGDGQEAVRLTQALRPGLVLVDVSMPGWSGVKVTQVIKHTCPHVKVIAISRHREKRFIDAMIEAGATGYVLKQSASEELVRAVRAVVGGARYIDSALSVPTPISDEADEVSDHDQLRSPPDLTLNEEHVLRLIAACYSNEEVARKLSIDASTVVALKIRAMQKTGLSSRVQVVAYGRALGWLESPITTSSSSPSLSERTAPRGPEHLRLRKRVGRPAISTDTEWLRLEELGTVFVSSEDPERPVELALVQAGDHGWRASSAGEQSMRISFEHPQSVGLIQIRFDEVEHERVQEFSLQWSGNRGGTFQPIVRQQFSFSPAGATREVENYNVSLERVTDLELRIVPDISGRDCVATLTSLRLKRV